MPSPLDFLHKNNNQDEWAKRYVGNKMGIQQMQKGGSPEDSYKVDPDFDYVYTRGGNETEKEEAMYRDWIDLVAKKNPKFLKEKDEPYDRWKFFQWYNQATESGEFPPDSLFNVHNPDFISPNPMFHPDTLEKIRLEREEANEPEGYQHGGAVFESAPADETAHDQMNNLLFENEMKQSQGASPLSFLNRDRIDRENQELMDDVMSSSTPMMGATKIAPFSKNVFSMLSKISQQNKKANLIKELYESKSKYLKSGKGGGWSKDEVNTLLKRDKESYKEAGEVLYRNNLLKRAMKEYNEHRMVRPSTEINIKNIPKSAIEDPFDWM